jgi:hypothetical protein
VFCKAPPQTKVDTPSSRDVPKASLRSVIHQGTAKVTTLTAKLVPEFFRRNKGNNSRTLETAQSNPKGILKVSASALQEEAQRPERSTLALAAAAQIPLQATIHKTHLSRDCGSSSTDSDSETFSEASPASTTASEPSTPKQLGAQSLPPPAPKPLTEEEQHDLDFAPIRAIPSELFKSVLLKHIDPTNYVTNPRVNIQRRTEGASHHVVMLQFGLGSFKVEYVIKFPLTGTKERWNEELAYTMRCEAMLMKHMEPTDIPVPEIRAVVDTIDNELGAPYILMRRMPGKGAYLLWSDRDDEDHLKADCPSAETEKKRQTFLRSLAHQMAKLQQLQFDKIGMLDFGRVLQGLQ